MILPAAIVLALLSVPLTGGSVRRLASVRLRASGAMIAALGLQVGVINVFSQSSMIELLIALHLLSYALAAYAVIVNLRHVAGLWLVALGGGMNALAIAANDGVMPASAGALHAAGYQHVADKFVNSGPVASANFAWLGDVFAWPAPLPLANVFSAGDVLLWIGFVVIVHRQARPPKPDRLNDDAVGLPAIGSV